MKFAHVMITFTALILLACDRDDVEEIRQEPPREQRQLTVEEAYQEILLSSTFPKDRTSDDVTAMESITRNPEQIVPSLVTQLSRSPIGNPMYPKVLAIFHLLPDQELKRSIAREVIGRLSVGEETPLLQFLAFNAEPQDIPRLAAEIEADPNGQGVAIAIALSQSGNDEAIRELSTLHEKAPGNWTSYLDTELVETSGGRTDQATNDFENGKERESKDE